MSEHRPPDALMLISSSCPYCSEVAVTLVELLKQGELSSIKLVNLELRPELAERHNVRSVPWVKIGDISTTGLTTQSELLEIAHAVGTADTMLLKLNELLTAGQLPKAREVVLGDARYLEAIMQIIGNPDSKINVRVGVGAILEDMMGSPDLKRHTEDLIKLTKHSSPTVRSDAAHYLSLVGGERVEAALKDLLNDGNKDVREIAQDGLDGFHDAT